MTPARFQAIEEIYRAALDREPDHVSAFMDKACKGDQVLRRKVEALLASRQRVGNFIKDSALDLATRVIEKRQADLLVGQTFGQYRICMRIGRRGLGQIYPAP